MFFYSISGGTVVDIMHRVNAVLREAHSPGHSSAFWDFMMRGNYYEGLEPWRESMPHGHKGVFDLAVKALAAFQQATLDTIVENGMLGNGRDDRIWYTFDTTLPTFKEVIASLTPHAAQPERGAGIEALSYYTGLPYMTWDTARQIVDRIIPNVDWAATEASTNGRIRVVPDWASIPGGSLHSRVWPEGYVANLPLLSGYQVAPPANERQRRISEWAVLDSSERGWRGLRDGDLTSVGQMTRNTFMLGTWHIANFMSDYGIDNDSIARDIARWRERRLADFRAGRGIPAPTAHSTRLNPVLDIDTAASRYDMHRAKKQHTSEIHISKMPVLPAGSPSSRRWGIEVETGAARLVEQVPDGWRNISDGSLYSAYDGEYIDPEDCEYADEHQEEIEVRVVATDQILMIDNPDYVDPADCDSCGEQDGGDSNDCREFVSPILTSVHSDGLRQLTDYLEPGPVTSSAGLHVHVEAEGLTASQVRELVMGYDAIEWLIEASYQREERGYCKRRSARELLSFARSVKANPSQRVQDIRKGDRYVTVNLQALDEHGTIEFRAMGPVYNYDHLTKWATFCREMVNAAGRGARAAEFAKVRNWDDLIRIFQKYGVEVAQATQSPVSVETEAEVVAA